ncbi:MAG TPA: hypothetical protein VGF45_12455 [Polyangia bacterium]
MALAVAASAWGDAAAAAESEARVRHERLGVEGAPAWVNLFRLTRPAALLHPSPQRVSVGFVGTVRFLRRDGQHWYFTPLQVGVGLANPGLSTLAHATTEFGLGVWPAGRRAEVGLAVGAGWVSVSYGTGCDGGCSVGGYPIVASPVIRMSLLTREDLTLKASVRAFIPMSRSWDSFSHFVGHAIPIFGGVDVSFAR